MPSMLHGRKGFERIVWAFENVLNEPLTWLFHDFDETVDTNTDGRSASLFDFAQDGRRKDAKRQRPNGAS